MASAVAPSSTAPTAAQKLRVGYIPEHFASPLLLLSRTPWGREHLELVPQPAGTGQVLSSFDASSPQGQVIDVAIALTESLIAGIAKGRRDLKLVGSYVRSSLVWAVSTGTSKEAEAFNSIDDLKSTTIGISRIGSGSQIMASVMAMQHGWTDETGRVSDLSFRINDTFANLRASVNDGSTSAFIWETFTTKPFYDSGEVRKIGEVPTPWPSWSIAASVGSAAALGSTEGRTLLDEFLARLQDSITEFTSEESFKASTPVDFIKQEMGYPEKDVVDWLATVRWVGDQRLNPSAAVATGQNTSTATVSRQTLISTLKTLQQAGVLQPEQAESSADPSIFVDPWGNGDVGRLVE